MLTGCFSSSARREGAAALRAACCTTPRLGSATKPFGWAGRAGGRDRSTRLAKVIGPNLDLVGDLDATGLTRYPPGLRDALIAMGKRGTAVGPATWGGSHLWLASPFQPGDDDPLTNAFDLHDPLIHRIDLLGEQ